MTLAKGHKLETQRASQEPERRPLHEYGSINEQDDRDKDDPGNNSRHYNGNVHEFQNVQMQMTSIPATPV
jgi:hypothetical protein